MKVPVRLAVNGAMHEVQVEPRRTLADALRKDCGLTGTHIGCEHGVCGSCTVIVDGEPVRSCLMFAVQAEGSEIVTIEGLAGLDQCRPEKSTPPPLAGGGRGEGALEVARVTHAGPHPPTPSRKGRGSGPAAARPGEQDDPLHPLQQAFIDHHGLQCGFCTPGFLMLAAAVLQRDPHIADAELIEALSSNLCRCTGYQGIIDAVLAAARAMRAPNSER